MDKSDKIAREEIKDQLEMKRSRDGQCPHCKAKSDSIVDKICQVQGKSNGKFRLGYGNIGILIDTEAVNHCNACGNEWKKFKTKEISQTHIIRLAFKYLYDIINNPEEKKKDWKLETIAVFNDCCAEAIFNLRFEYRYNLTDGINSKLTLSRIRKYYWSIYGAPASAKLEKL
jgi:hypothetical protein